MYRGVSLFIVLIQLVVVYPKSLSGEDNQDFESVFEKNLKAYFKRANCNSDHYGK